MNSENIKFPVYRKYKNNKSYFKISSLTDFEELQIVGSKIFHRQIKVQQYPEKVFINDLLYQFQEMAEEVTKDEFDKLLKKATKQ